MSRVRRSRRLYLHRYPVALAFAFLRMLIPIGIVLLVVHALASPETLERALPGFDLVMFYRLALLALLLEMLRRYYNDLYIFGRNRVIHYQGRLSLRARTLSICYADIREITVQQSLIGRLLNYGTLVLGTAASDPTQMELHDLAKPHKLAELAGKLTGPSSPQNHNPKTGATLTVTDD